MKYRVKHLIEYGLIRTMAGLVNVLPYRLALFVGWKWAWLGFHVLRFRRAEADRRMVEVFGDRFTPRERRKIAWLSLRNVMFTAVDIMRTPYITQAKLDKISDYQQPIELLLAHHQTGRGGVFALPHMGAWELPGRAMTLRGIPFFSVAGKQRNPLFDYYLNTTREKSGMPILMRGASTLKDIIRRLKSGQMLAILPDVRMRTEAVKVKFLGKEANIGGGMAMFARHANVPIFPVIVTRVGWAKHVAHIYPPVWSNPVLDKDEDIRQMSQAVMNIVSEAIMAHPEQWFWYNKRWVLEPVEEGGV